MYQELEMYKEYQKEKQIKHNHEAFANVSALTVITIVANSVSAPIVAIVS